MRPQARSLRLGTGGIRRDGDRDGCKQQQARENGSETRRVARRVRFHEARTVATLACWCVGLC